MLRLKYSLFVIFAATVLCAENEDNNTTKFAVELNADNFNDAIAQKNHFLMFYVSWCAYSVRLFPIWEKLAETFNIGSQSRVIIAKFDCQASANEEICSKNEILVYPTLKFFKPNATNSTKFMGDRNLPLLTNFINELLGDGKSEEKKKEEDEDKSFGPDSIEALLESLFGKDALNILNAGAPN